MKIDIPISTEAYVDVDTDVEIDIKDILDHLDDKQLRELISMAKKLLPADECETIRCDKLFPKPIKEQMVKRYQKNNKQIKEFI